MRIVFYEKLWYFKRMIKKITVLILIIALSMSLGTALANEDEITVIDVSALEDQYEEQDDPAIPLPAQTDPPIQTSSARKRVAYLTFDDGPVRDITCRILDILEREGIPATFFVLPKKDNDDIFWRMINEGHEIANHSSTHNYYRLYGSSIDSFLDDVMANHYFIKNRFGYTMTSFRFPGGPFGRPPEVIEERREALAAIGYREFVWCVDPQDWRDHVRAKGGRQLASLVLYQVGGLSDRRHINILFHDTSGTTVSALPYVIAGLRERGFTFDITRNFPFSNEEIEMFEEVATAQRTARINKTRLRQHHTTLATESLE